MSEIEDRVCQPIQERAAKGVQKYGVTMEWTDLGLLDWLIHTQEEMLDASVHLERLRGLCEQINEAGKQGLAAETEDQAQQALQQILSLLEGHRDG